MKVQKLISGNMNIPYIVCKPGYAEGSNKPKKEVKKVEKQTVFKVRKNEKLIA